MNILNEKLINDVPIEPLETQEKFKPQRGSEHTTLCDLVGCSNHWATGDSMVSKGLMWVFDTSCITLNQITSGDLSRQNVPND